MHQSHFFKLNGWTQYVTCNGSQSSTVDVVSGVPHAQGTVAREFLWY